MPQLAYGVVSGDPDRGNTKCGWGIEMWTEHQQENLSSSSAWSMRRAGAGRLHSLVRWSTFFDGVRNSNPGAVDDYGDRKRVAMAETKCHRAIIFHPSEAEEEEDINHRESRRTPTTPYSNEIGRDPHKLFSPNSRTEANNHCPTIATRINLELLYQQSQRRQKRASHLSRKRTHLRCGPFLSLLHACKLYFRTIAPIFKARYGYTCDLWLQSRWIPPYR
ncbi:hypothetical protein EAE99_011248 [Botrytis elliptica]|nr:hypothetical protein EAE99_011248 [Botrytis elliptica]